MNENKEMKWEEEFYELTKTMDGQLRPKLKQLFFSYGTGEYEKGKGVGIVMALNKVPLTDAYRDIRHSIKQEYLDL